MKQAGCQSVVNFNNLGVVVAKTLSLEVRSVKNIENCNIEFDFEPGVYAIVGSNGCGKSTLMQILSILVKTDSIFSLDKDECSIDSKISLKICETVDAYVWDGQWRDTSTNLSYLNVKNKFRGFYEGSIFYGTRFYDYSKIDSVMGAVDIIGYIRDADDYVKNTLSYILHGDHDHYRSLKKIKSKKISASLGFQGIPYFFMKDQKVISQFKMSSGECMLISLIDFVYNIIERKNYKENETLLLCIDEVELALHPSAIDRIVDFFQELAASSRYNLVVYFSTHSSEIIQKIKPANIVVIENDMGTIVSTSPCYPNYAIRNLYVPNGFDYLILVEDELAKLIVDKIIKEETLGESRLICVLPSGGWSQTLKLHYDIINYNALGKGRKIVSIFDGDVIEIVRAKKEYSMLPKEFIPIPSIEKYLMKKLVLEKDVQFTKHIGDQYFTQISIKSVVADYLVRNSKGDSNGKKLYRAMLEALRPTGIDESKFVSYLCDDIFKFEKVAVDAFRQKISNLVS